MHLKLLSGPKFSLSDALQ